MKRTGFLGVANRSNLKQRSHSSANEVLSAIRSIARAVTADHALAQRAAIEAALPRKHLAVLRAMCFDERELAPDGAQRASPPKKARPDWPGWSSPFPKPRR